MQSTRTQTATAGLEWKFEGRDGRHFFRRCIFVYRYIVLSEIVFKPSCAQCSSCVQSGKGGGRVQAVDDDDKDIVKDL